MIASRVADRVLDAVLSEDRVLRLRSNRGRRLVGLLYIGVMGLAIGMPVLGALVTSGLGVAGAAIGGLIAVFVGLPCARFLQTERARDLAVGIYRGMCTPGDLEAGGAIAFAVEYGDYFTAVVMYADEFGVGYDAAKTAIHAMIRDQGAHVEGSETPIMC